MTSAVLDEEAIMDDLALAVSEESCVQMQRACTAAMFDIYDRKVTREQYGEMLGACLALYSSLHKLFIINNVKASFYKNEINAGNLHVTIRHAEDNVRSQCGNVQHIMDLLSQCPNDEDKIN